MLKIKILFGLFIGVFATNFGKDGNLLPLKLDPETNQIRDSSGVALVLRGVNVVVKNHPYIPSEDTFDPQMSLNDKDIDDLVRWGFNIVRLGVIWEAVEVEPGVYNNTYLDKIEKLVNKLGESGIYSIIDSHQDLFSRVNCGEGVPLF